MPNNGNMSIIYHENRVYKGHMTQVITVII